MKTARARWGSQHASSPSRPARRAAGGARAPGHPGPRPRRRARSLVAVSAASLNFGDIARCRGTVASVMGQVPFTIGMDVCGVVEAAGAGGEEWVGRRVVATTRPVVRRRRRLRARGRDRRVRRAARVRRRAGRCVHAAVPHRLPRRAAQGEAAGGGGVAGDRWRHRGRHRGDPARHRRRRARRSRSRAGRRRASCARAWAPSRSTTRRRTCSTA